MADEPTKMEIAMEEAYARLTMLEFSLEVIYANWLAGQPPQVSDAFKRDLVEKAKKGYGPITADPQAIASMQRIGKRTNEMMERFAKKVAVREREFRGKRPPVRPRQP